MRHTEHTLLVRPVSGEAIVALLNASMPCEAGTEYRVHDFGLIENVTLSNECIYSVNEQKVVDNNRIAFVFDAPVRIRTIDTNDCHPHSMFPDFYLPLTIETLESLAGQPVSLKDFMGSRYNYNPRIKTNMREFIKDIGSQIPETA